VYFEALANALDAGADDIEIEIKIESFDKPETLTVEITDNGSGFTEENFERFKTLLKPRDGYHKGVGRLVFLNYFENIKVDSVWGVNRREFVFKENFDHDVPVEKLKAECPNKTRLFFTNFCRSRVKAYDDLRPSPLKERIIEHFLPMLYQRVKENQVFKITIRLITETENDQKSFFSDEVFITAVDLPEMESVEIKDEELHPLKSIDMLYHVKQSTGKGTKLIAVAVDGRTIPISLVRLCQVVDR